jgi:hypothetical protein
MNKTNVALTVLRSVQVPLFVVAAVACLRLRSLARGYNLQGVRHVEGTVHQVDIFGI